MSGSLLCPACNTSRAPKTFALHTQQCAAWKGKGWEPLPTFKYDPWSKPELFTEGAQEGTDYLRCQVCAQYGLDFRFSRLKQHVAAHGLSVEQYEARFPGSHTGLAKTLEKRQSTTLEKYGVDNVSRAPEVKVRTREVFQEKYGVDHPAQLDWFQKKQAATNVERYGAANPFASDEIKLKVRRTMLERYGAENPQQVEEIRLRTLETSIARFGSSSFLQSAAWFAELAAQRREREITRRDDLIASGQFDVCPHCDEVFKAITSTHKAICKGWPTAADPEPCLCGHESGSFTSMKRHRNLCAVWIARDPDAVARARRMRTVLEKYGVEHISFVPEIKARIGATNLERFGVKSPLESPEIQARILETNLNRYGGPTSFSSTEVQDKVKATFQRKYGVHNPFATPQVQEKALRTALTKIGVELAQYPTPAQTPEDLLERYGVTHPLQHRDYALYHFTTYLDPMAGPNGFESKVHALAPQLLYTGNRTFWRWLPRLGKHKNPDFLLPGPDVEHPFRDVSKVVECFGSYFHGQALTGIDPLVHEQETVAAYAEIGLQALVIWEEELAVGREEVRQKLEAFLSQGPRIQR